MIKKSSLLIPSIEDVLFISTFLYLSFAGQGLLADGDTGYHIRAGDFMLDALAFPFKDPFSYLHPPLAWTAHEWLSEIIMALIHRQFGLTGIVLFFGFIIASAYYLLFKVVQTYKSNILIAIVLVILTLASSTIHWLARPHIFSLVLIIIWYYLLDDFQYNNRNRLYFLPLIMLLWVNLHGGYMAGFILASIYLFGNLFKAIVHKDAEASKKARKIGIIIVGCLFATLINPYGYDILLFPFKLTSNQFIMDHVTEWLSPNFHEPMLFKYLLFIMLAILAVSRKSLNIIETGLVLLFTYMSLYSARYIPLFGIITAPILIRQADALLDGESRFKQFIRKRAERIAATDAMSKGYLFPILTIALVVIFAASGGINYAFDEKTKPVAAVEFLKKEQIKGNMFNDDEFGDYIIYAAWPQYKVFFDGRSDMYGADRMKEYFKITRIEPGWEKVIEKYRIDWVIYKANSAISLFLMERKDWHLIYADKVANIFVKDTPENRYLINKYPDVNLVIEEDKDDK